MFFTSFRAPFCVTSISGFTPVRQTFLPVLQGWQCWCWSWRFQVLSPGASGPLEGSLTTTLTRTWWGQTETYWWPSLMSPEGRTERKTFKNTRHETTCECNLDTDHNVLCGSWGINILIWIPSEQDHKSVPYNESNNLQRISWFIFHFFNLYKIIMGLTLMLKELPLLVQKNYLLLYEVEEWKWVVSWCGGGCRV